MSETQQRLRAARAYAGLTLDELAERVGMGRMTIIRMERGEREPKRMELREIAEATDLPLEFFTEDFAGLAKSAAAEKAQLDRIEQLLQHQVEITETWIRDEWHGSQERRALIAETISELSAADTGERLLAAFQAMADTKPRPEPTRREPPRRAPRSTLSRTPKREEKSA